MFGLRKVPRSLIDDEYANVSVSDPKIMLTTSRNPSAPLTQFVKVNLVFFTYIPVTFCELVCFYTYAYLVCKQELKIVFPKSIRMNRGSQVWIFSNLGIWLFLFFTVIVFILCA
jgi:hypothetical protein